MSAATAPCRRVAEGFDVRAPEGAMHIWISLPGRTSASEFVRAAQERGVLLRPASHYSADGAPAPNAVRASLSSPANAEAVESGTTFAGHARSDVAQWRNETAPVSIAAMSMTAHSPRAHGKV